MPKPKPKTTKSAASVDDFLDSIADAQRKADSYALVRMMEKATGSKATMWGAGIVGFGTWSKEYADGSEQQWMRTAFAPRSNRITLYISPGFKTYDKLMANLGKFSAGKSCIHIKRLADLHLPTLRQLIKDAAESAGT